MRQMREAILAKRFDEFRSAFYGARSKSEEKS
jgi:queuine/archaeosine tRNA-ribosyltransferase